MISLDQIRILEQKVESIVVKMSHLIKENEELKQKCVKLEQAGKEASAKLSAYEQDQSKIEQGILNALDRLNTVENSVLQTAGQFQSVNNILHTAVPLQTAGSPHKEEPIQQPQFQDSNDAGIESDDSEMEENENEESLFDPPINQNNGQFDIF